jgi:transcriptional regulator with XRE-family HTH domain
MDTIGKRIHYLRTQKAKMTQLDFADLCSVSFETVSRWENDRRTPALTSLRAMAKRHKVKLSWLLDGEGIP